MLKQHLKSCWKQVATIGGAIVIISSVIAFDTRFAKTIAVDKEFLNVRTEVASAINEVKKSLQLQQDITRLNSMTDQMARQKQLIKIYPKDIELKDDYENMKNEKIKIQQQIEKRM